MDFKILGPLEVRDGDRPLRLGGARQRALLALLLLRANEVVSSDRLILELWGDERLEDASKALQVAVSRLRRTLHPRGSPDEPDALLVTRAPGYELRLDRGQLDLRCFEDRAAAGKQALAAGDPAGAAAILRDALALWRGSPLADLAYASFAQTEIDRLEELRLATVEARIEADLALGRHADLVAELEGLTDQYPLRERLRFQLMLALYRSRRQAEALETYRETRRVLVEQLGIEPGPELRELHEAILNQDPALAPQRAPERPRGSPSGQARPAVSVDRAPTAGEFVGRGHELAEFLAGLEDARAGRSALFLIAGEPGIGKSRLAAELTAHAEARGAKVLWGRCWEAGGAPAYWPWVQALRAYIRDVDRERLRAELGGGAADIAQMLPELRELFPDLPPPPRSLDPEGARFRLFDSTASFLRASGTGQPLVVVLDDLHAGDAPSLLLLRFLAHELRDARVVLVGAYRDREAGAQNAVRETMAELHREPITRPVQLGGLGPAEVARFIESVAGTAPSARLSAAIQAETEGNPLFVGELVRLLAAEGRLQEAGHPDWRPSIPRGLRDVIGHRLRHLSADCKRLLSVASVLGREFRLDALERVSERPADEMLGLLDEARVARVIGELPSARGGLRFSHALIRDSLYGDLVTSDRLQLHRRTAEVLEELYAQDAEPYLAEIAHHFLEAATEEDVGKAVDYARRAGDRAATLLAYEEAARLYLMALEALDLGRRTDDHARCDLLLCLGDSEARGGDLAAAKEAFLRAAQLARQLGSPQQLARAALGYGGRFAWFRAGGDRRLIALLEAALAALPSGDSVLRARVLGRLAGALRDDPVPERRAALTREAVEIARRLGDRATLAYSLEATYAALSWPADTAQWLETIKELTRLAEQVGDSEQVFIGRLHEIAVSMVRGELHAVPAQLRRALAVAEELRQPAQMWGLAITRGMLAAFAGRIEEADEWLQKAAELGAGAQGLDATFYSVMNLQEWTVRRAQGRLAEVEQSVAGFLEEHPSWHLLRCVLASIHSELGHEQQARDELELIARDDFASLHLGTEWFFSASLLAEVCAFLGDSLRAARLYELLSPYANFNVISHPEVALGSASRYLGILAATIGRWDDAARHFEHALSMNTRIGARPWVAHTQVDYACMLRARDAPGDRQKAIELTREAHATYRRLGMESWATKLEESSPPRSA